MKTLGSVLRSIAAAMLGFVVISLGTILTFNVLVGQLVVDSPPQILILGTFGAALSGLLGGLTAGFIARRHPLFHAAGILVFIALDTASILARGPGPAWFDLAGSGVLAITALIGGWLAGRWKASIAPNTPVSGTRHAQTTI